MIYTFYILYSAVLDKYYIGYTGDGMTARLRRHLSDRRGYTGKAKDWQLVYWGNYKYDVIVAAILLAFSTYP